MVLTHLVQFKFYHGATVGEAVVPATFAGHTTFPPFYAFKGFSVGDAVPEPEPEPSTGLVGGGGSGKKYRRPYNYDSLDLNKWRKRTKRLEARLEVVQKKIQQKRDRLDEAVSLETITALKKQIAVLQALLMDLLGQLDMARKGLDEAEMADALAAYLAYRRLH